MESQKTIDDTVELATIIFKNVTAILNQGKVTPDAVREFLFKNYPTFANAYPLVLKFMYEYKMYNPIGLRNYIKSIPKMKVQGESDMEVFILKQCSYIRHLYQAECRRTGIHLDQRKLSEIYNTEYKSLKDWVTKIKTYQEDAKSEYKEFNEKNIAELKMELFDFVSSQSDDPQSHNQ